MSPSRRLTVADRISFFAGVVASIGEAGVVVFGTIETSESTESNHAKCQ
jgi:hypothetical protein